MKNAARAAKNLGVKVVNGFTGSSIWHLIYSFPPVTRGDDRGRVRSISREMWNPILDVFDECGVKFALEVHPTEIAFDIVTAQRALKAIGRPARPSDSTSTRAICTGRWWIRRGSSRNSRTGSTTST